MGKVLILDDDPMRYPALITYAKAMVYDAEIIMVLDAEAAKEVLKRFACEWDLLLLDHDLGGMVYVDSNQPNTGYEVAKFISEHGVKFKTCIIHSMNTAGVRNMKAELEGLGDVYHTPFAMML
jgi:hypothetical protein